MATGCHSVYYTLDPLALRHILSNVLPNIYINMIIIAYFLSIST
jgi:hypothetical protein